MVPNIIVYLRKERAAYPSFGRRVKRKIHLYKPQAVWDPASVC